MNERFVLCDGGLWMYYLGARGKLSWRGEPIVPDADGQPMSRLSAPGWWATNHEATTITVRKPVPAKTIGYRLTDPMTASERFPNTLTLAEWESRSPNDVEWELYTAVTEPQPDEVITIDGPWLRLDGTPPPTDDDRTWVPRLPDALRNRPEYYHLFPGELVGFRDHIKQLAQAHRYKQFVFLDHKGKPGVYVSLQVPFDQPITEYRPALNRDGSGSRPRKGKTVTVTARRELVLDVPHRIAGANRAEAAARWDELTAHYQALLDEASVAACSHCRGHGYVPQRAEETSRG
ncbi:hypothetical protein E1287_25805 [Actinomadura sp. KC06]|uniref:hypothetical protein n=1 Tax=Actinomadura sp. KC06 TaxID=2530369 RepID=UPI001050C8EA|nr:hypothetical protein [Actinomadura sp. KC06]TDD31679.1 hypothetical protein E1287_25805 [Actinomadura sp. KC06]